MSDPTELLKVTEELDNLRKQINKHRESYYTLDAPIISDEEYDVLYLKYLQLEKDYPEAALRIKRHGATRPDEKVGDKLKKEFKKIKHVNRMYSLDNVFNFAQLDEWENRNLKLLDLEQSEIDYVAELKLDGLAVSLIYKDGLFYQGATRGDGIYGEDITKNLMEILNLPKRVPLFVEELCASHNIHELEVRGEIIMPYSSFIELNEQQKLLAKPGFANPRNAAAGSVRQLDTTVTAKRGLKILFYHAAVISITDPITSKSIPIVEQWRSGFSTSRHSGMLNALEKMKFEVNPGRQYCKNLNDVKSFINKWDTERHKLDFATDGCVIKIDKTNLHDFLGYTAKAPRWAIAYKYKAETAETVVKDIEFSVGRTGVITPVAIMEPVFLSGSTVQRASLHNFEELAKKDVRVGDTVKIQKAAEIIPEVIEVVLDKRPPIGTYQVEMSSQCPECGTRTIKNEGEVALRCPNQKGCPAQVLGKLEHWVNKGGMDIDGVGPALLEQLIETGLIETPVDLYKLSLEQLLGLERMAQKSAENALNAIEASKKQPLYRLINALGIRHIGKETAIVLAQEFGSIEAISNTTLDRLSAIDGVGLKVAESIIEYFGDYSNQQMLSELKALGVNTEDSQHQGPTAQLSETFSGNTFVLTGTLPTMTREEAESLIRQHGGKISSSVSKKTSYLLAGENSGSKYSKAEQLGVRIISESDLLNLLNTR